MIHGGVGVFDQGLGILAVVREETDADAGANEEIVVLNDHLALQVGNEAVGDGGHGVRTVEVREDDSEFVPADPGDGVDIAYRLTETVGDLDQDSIAGFVT